ncbi:hypothetical protein FHV99_004574 [Ochrobactrum sp. P20RRXII]|nr:hypothetical protein [Ochrobactrum sp. P20RRXII]NIH77322.1 hypothetical protein [Ochrobactrum sp. P20RRXII]
MELFTVHFTEKKIIDVYGSSGRDKGKKIREYVEDIPRTIHALPLSTALQYKDCDNYRRVKYVIGDEKVSYKAHNGARKATNSGSVSFAAKSKAKASSAIKNAAMTGDMSAAINAEV